MILFFVLACQRSTEIYSWMYALAVPGQQEVIVSAGKYVLDKDLIVPVDKRLILAPGVELAFPRSGRLIVNGALKAQGTSELPILFRGINDAKWRGIIFERSQRGPLLQLENDFLHINLSDYLKKHSGAIHESVFEYCIFRNLADLDYAGGKVNNQQAVLELNDRTVSVKNSVFQKIDDLSAIQMKNSSGIIAHNVFESCGIHKTIHWWNSEGIIAFNSIIQRTEKKKCNDGLWILESNAFIYQNKIDGKGDDGIDLKNSSAFIFQNEIKNNKDDGIDLDYQSTALIAQNKIEGNGDNGILVSESNAYIYENKINSNKRAITLRNGAHVWEKDNSWGKDSKFKLYFDLKEMLYAEAEKFERLQNYSSLHDREELNAIVQKIKKHVKKIVAMEKDALWMHLHEQRRCNILYTLRKDILGDNNGCYYLRKPAQWPNLNHSYSQFGLLLK